MQEGIYTKKVLDLFKKPHNYGKIKNPDGVGKVGNIVCLLPGQNIHMNSGIKEINAVSIKDKVLSHNGLYNNVTSVATRNYSGKIFVIKNKLGKISLTDEHLILAIKIPQEDKFLRTKNKKTLISAWYHANQLKKGDIILYPISKEKKDLDYIEVNIPKPKYDFKSFDIPNKIPLNQKFLRLAGYFLSKGNVQDRPYRTFVTFSLNIKEKDIVKDIKKISKDLFGLNIVVREKKDIKSVVIYLYSARLARFFKQIFRNDARYKRIPDFIMNLPSEKQKSLIYGLWKGDGYINIEREGAGAGYSTISLQIAQQLKTLLLRQNIMLSIYTEKKKTVKGVNHQKNYRLHIGQRDSLTKMCNIMKIRYVPRSYKSEDSWFDKNYLYTPITKVETKNYKDVVYNLEVNESRSFTSEAFCLHNCGDVMWLYIKIGKNNKKQEILKDIRFETFGCVAAISTSSIITDLARGKTIKQALKITKENVVDSLGGLPKIKFHCSVLAIDALAEAIFDYLSRNKKNIPAELQKRHERIQKEKEIIEKRYKNSSR